MILSAEETKKKFIENYRSFACHIGDACESVAISRNTFHVWMREDPIFNEDITSIDEAYIDTVERKLKEHIGNDSLDATKFHLKTKGKRRGYVERTEVTGAEGGPINIVFNIANEEVKKSVDAASL